MGVSRSLTSINLSYNYGNRDFGKAIVAGIRDSWSLNSIDVGTNGIDQAAALELLAAMKEKAMVSIGMAGCDLGVEGAKVLAEMMAVSRLTELQIGSNPLGAEGVRFLIEGCKLNSSLKVISFGNYWDNDEFKMGPEGAKHVADLLSVSRSLRQVLALFSHSPAHAHTQACVIYVYHRLCALSGGSESEQPGGRGRESHRGGHPRQPVADICRVSALHTHVASESG